MMQEYNNVKGYYEKLRRRIQDEEDSDDSVFIKPGIKRIYILDGKFLSKIILITLTSSFCEIKLRNKCVICDR